MTIIRWAPLSDLDRLQREIDRVFHDDSFWGTPVKDKQYTPAAELTETETAYELKFELPGFDRSELDVKVTADTVTVSGERKETPRDTDSPVKVTKHRSEFRYGKFHREVTLANSIQTDTVTAAYTNGVLHLTLIKVVEDKHKVVKIDLQ
jgi:HSP20 family protein